MRPRLILDFTVPSGASRTALNFAVIQALQIAQDYRFAQFRREPREALLQLPAQFRDASASLSGVRAADPLCLELRHCVLN